MAWREYRALRRGSRLLGEAIIRSRAASGWTAGWSAIHGPLRSGLRTRHDRRPPRHRWDRADPRRSWWQLTTRPPRGRSGSQLPVECRVVVSVRAGRTAVKVGKAGTGVLW